MTSLKSAKIAQMTAMSAETPTCSRCGKHFTKVSSRNRHARQCLQGLKPPPRRKACRACASSKLRCGLEKPSCQRCLSRSIECNYGLHPAATAGSVRQDIETIDGPTDASSLPEYWPTPESSHTGNSTENNDTQASTSIPSLPESSIPKIYGQDGTAFRPATGGPFANGVVSKQCAHTMVRTMKSWSRLMSEYTESEKRLPPIIHLQQVDTTGHLPAALANCVALTKMWAGHDVGLGELVDSTVRGEVRRLLDAKDTCSNELDLLAAGQSLVLLLVILLFGIKQDPTVAASSTSTESIEARNSANAKLVIEVWDIREMLMKTSFVQNKDGVLPQVDPSSPTATVAAAVLTPMSISSSASSSRTTCSVGSLTRWQSWAYTSATRRTIIALHNLEIAWACLNKYPIMSCFGLYHLPLPEAGYLWRADTEGEWRRLFLGWRKKWYGEADAPAEPGGGSGSEGLSEGRGDGWSTQPRKTGPYVLAEYVNIKPGEPLDDRAERWLAEADEFGVMLMSVVSAVYDT